MANEFDIKQAQLQRRRGLYDALTQASLQAPQGQMVSGHYVAPGLLDQIARPITALLAGYGQQQVDKQEQENTAARTAGLAQALQQIRANTAAGGSFGQGALTSGYSELQPIGQAVLAAELKPKPQETFQPMTSIENGQLKTNLVGNHGTVKSTELTPPPKYSAERGQLFDVNTGTPGNFIGTAPQPSSTNIYNQMPGKVEETAFTKALGPEMSKRYTGALDQLDASAQNADMLQRIQQLEALPKIQGTGADVALRAAQIGSLFGFKMPDKVTNTAQLDAIVKTELLNFIKQGGRGITNEEGQKFLEANPSIASSPESAKALRIMLQNANDRQTQRAKQTISIIQQRYPEVQGLENMVKQPLPPIQGQNPGQQPSTGIKFLGFE